MLVASLMELGMSDEVDHYYKDWILKCIWFTMMLFTLHFESYLQTNKNTFYVGSFKINVTNLFYITD